MFRAWLFGQLGTRDGWLFLWPHSSSRRHENLDFVLLYSGAVRTLADPLRYPPSHLPGHRVSLGFGHSRLFTGQSSCRGPSSEDHCGRRRTGTRSDWFQHSKRQEERSFIVIYRLIGCRQRIKPFGSSQARVTIRDPGSTVSAEPHSCYSDSLSLLGRQKGLQPHRRSTRHRLD